ncbi:MAG: response regulator [Polyangiaceae bacterium]
MSHRLAILVVDDDDLVGAALLRLLKRDHDVRHITSGEAAPASFASGERAFDPCWCDLTMPGMGGEALYTRVREAWPRLRLASRS